MSTHHELRRRPLDPRRVKVNPLVALATLLGFVEALFVVAIFALRAKGF